MLQQTQAARVAVAYPRFLRRFPTVGSLARASRATVLRAWGDLGYNRRAVALSEAARTVVREHGGRFPREIDALDRLPGVGPYTAAAVASLAYGEPVAAVDTNVRRVVARVHLGAEGHEVAPGEVASLARSWVDPRDPGSWNQAVMDLGREVCRPRPRCEVCPLARVCRFRSAGTDPRPSPRRQGSFEGSTRQVRGAVVRALRDERSATLGRLARLTGFEMERVAVAVSALAGDGLVDAGAAALAGRAGGHVRLATAHRVLKLTLT
ncbi:MAG: A/G-specific adenine glycosylase [Actinobacteria bacterium]|nr:A/G-specific adenine glycosylase [Actinomycetota bacterium]